MQPTYLSCAETAKLLRNALKEAFPGIKFGVRSSVYSGGASIDVTWTDGPRSADVDELAKRFAGSTFDGMTDMKSSVKRTLDGIPTRFAADFVFCTQALSAGRPAATLAALGELTDGERDLLRVRLGVQLAYGCGETWERTHAWDRQAIADQVARAMLPRIEPKPSATAERVAS
jgi:hypothetical protein